MPGPRLCRTTMCTWRVRLAGGLRGFEALDADRGDQGRPELEHLDNAAGGQLRARQSGGEADEVLDPRRAARLPARAQALQDQGVDPFGGGVDGGGDA